jgi:sugar phosphate permease
MLNKSIGYVNAYYVFGIVGFVAFMLGFLALKDYPEDCGCFPDNNKTLTREQVNQELEEGKMIIQNSPWTVKRMLRTKETWLISLSCGLMLMFAMGFMNQMIPRLLFSGYSIDIAVRMMSISALCSCAGSVLCGELDKRFGPRKSIIMTHIGAIMACLLNLIPGSVSVMISMVFIGIAVGGSSNFLTSIISSYWGRYNFIPAQRVMLSINHLIGASGAVIVAQIAARYHYTGSYIVVACLSFVGILLMLPVKDNAIKKLEKKYKAEDAVA